MNRRMSGGDASLNATVGSEGEGTMQWQDWLEDEDADQATDYEERDELEARREMLAEAMEVLNDREKDILTQRRLADQPSRWRSSAANTMSAASVFARSRCGRSRNCRRRCATWPGKRACSPAREDQT